MVSTCGWEWGGGGAGVLLEKCTVCEFRLFVLAFSFIEEW